MAEAGERAGPRKVAAGTLLALQRLFKLDSVTHGASVELWVLLTTLLLVLRFLLDFSGPWFGNPRRMFIVLTLEILNQNLVIYTMGLMQLSGGTRVNDYFQVWAVLLVTLQYSVKIGRPYTRSKQVPLLDLMSSFWSANLLRVQTFNLLRFPLWLIWSLNAVRILVLFVTTSKGETRNQESMRLVSDYMSYEDNLPAAAGDAAAGDDQEKSFMSGYKYLVHGEHRVLKEVQEGPREGSSSERSYKVQLNPDGDHKKQLVTVEKVWNNTSESGLLGGAADHGNKRKDLCLSFALYKLLRRRFYDLPIHELTRPHGKAKISRLVFEYIIEDCERAFRITGVELSFLQDLFYSKHATVFAGGLMVPFRSLLLSLSLAAATGYISYPARYIPERMDPADRNTITHGVLITRIMVAIIVFKELLEIILYVLSRWAKVLVLCKYVQHQCLWRPVMERAMRFMLFFGSKAKWNQWVCQQNLLVTNHVRSLGVLPPLTMKKVLRRGVVWGRTGLKDHTKDAILLWLKKLNKEGLELDNYFSNAFGPKEKVEWQWPSNLKVDTHIILVWHIATCLCEINFFSNVKKLKAVQRPRPFVRESNGEYESFSYQEDYQEYVAAVTLSNYCTYLVKRALVPDNALVAEKVIEEVIKEIDYVTSKVSPGKLDLKDVYNCLMETVKKPCKILNQYQSGGPADTEVGGGDQDEEEEEDDEDDEDLDIGCSLTKMGAELGRQLTEVYAGDKARLLWRDLACFWMGLLLHLAANTRAATHAKHLAGDSELITHLWALLSHAGFRGNVVDSEAGPDQEDNPDINQEAAS